MVNSTKLKILPSVSRYASTIVRTTAESNVKRSSVDDAVIERKTFADIPAARRLPFVGTKLDFVLAGAGKKLHKYVDDRHRTLGPVFREALGPADMVFVSCPTAMRQLFKYEGRYPKHPLPEAWTMYNQQHQSKRGLFFMDDTEWLNNRKIMSALMLGADSQSAVHDVILKTCDDFVADWTELLNRNQSQGVEIPNLIQSLYTWSVRGVSAVVLGDIVNGPRVRPLIEQLSRMLPELFENSAPLMSFPPALAKRFRLRIWTNFERTVSEILAVANEIADVALAEVKGGSDEGGACLMAGMLQHNMPEDVIKRIFIDLILAAGDTTAYTMQWALYLLARDRTTQQLVRNHVQQSEQTLDSPIVRGAVRETMRLYPVAYIIGRVVAVDAVIAGFDVPKNTMVLASLYTAGRSSDNFPDASQFRPLRWTRDSSGKYLDVTKPGASIPYALGARSCVGQKLANTQMYYLITRLTQHFDLQLLNEREVDVDIKMVMVPSETIRIAIDRIDNTNSCLK